MSAAQRWLARTAAWRPIMRLTHLAQSPLAPKTARPSLTALLAPACMQVANQACCLQCCHVVLLAPRACALEGAGGNFALGHRLTSMPGRCCAHS